MKYALTIFLLLMVAVPSMQMDYMTTEAQSDKLLIVGTMTFLADVAKGILLENAETKGIIGSGVDPHVFEPSASDIQALTDADLIIASGIEELDEWLTEFIEDNPSFQDKLVYAFNESDLVHDPLINAPNPHYWLSIDNLKIVATNIAEAVNQNNPEFLDETGLSNYMRKLNQTWDTITEAKEILKGKKVVVDHPAFFYLLTDLEMNRKGVLEEKEGVDPSPAHIEQLVTLMKEENITQIVASQIQAGSDVLELAERTGANISYLDVFPQSLDGNGMIELFNSNLGALKNPIKHTSTNEASFPPIAVFSLGFAIIASGMKKRKDLKR